MVEAALIQVAVVMCEDEHEGGIIQITQTVIKPSSRNSNVSGLIVRIQEQHDDGIKLCFNSTNRQTGDQESSSSGTSNQIYQGVSAKSDRYQARSKNSQKKYKMLERQQ